MSAAFRELLLEVKAAEPELVVLGDYIRDPDDEQLTVHRENIIKAIQLIPFHGHWCLETTKLGLTLMIGSEFERLGVRAMENEVTVVETVKGPFASGDWAISLLIGFIL